jgi:hypothetical protein
MATTVFPVASSSSSGATANAITCASSKTIYGANVSLGTGIYTITCVSSTEASVEFYSNINTLITSAKTVSGSVSVNLGTAADRVRIWTNTGTNVVVTITLTASAMTNNISGTLDTITSSSTYTGTSNSGYAFVMIVGGGAGGGGGWGSGSGYNGGGGGSGGLYKGVIQLTGSMPIVIGARGNAGGISQNGSAGGSTTFAGLTATGGSAGLAGVDGGPHRGSSAGGTPNQTFDSSRSHDWIFIADTPLSYGAGGGGGTGGGWTYGVGAPGSNGTAGAVYILKF